MKFILLLTIGAALAMAQPKPAAKPDPKTPRLSDDQIKRLQKIQIQEKLIADRAQLEAANARAALGLDELTQALGKEACAEWKIDIAECRVNPQTYELRREVPEPKADAKKIEPPKPDPAKPEIKK